MEFILLGGDNSFVVIIHALGQFEGEGSHKGFPCGLGHNE